MDNNIFKELQGSGSQIRTGDLSGYEPGKLPLLYPAILIFFVSLIAIL